MKLTAQLSNVEIVFEIIIVPSILKMSYYAVANGRTKGIFHSWAECEAQVKGFSGAKYKKFPSASEAQNFIRTHSGIDNSKVTKEIKKYANYNTNVGTSSNPVPNFYNKPLYIPKKKYSTNSSKSDHIKRPAQDIDSDDSDIEEELWKQVDEIENSVRKAERNINKIIKNSIQKQTIMINQPVTKKVKKDNNFEIDSDGYVQVYTDGACSNNGTKSARAGLGVFWGNDHKLNLCEPVSGRATNNCGEIQAATKAIRIAMLHNVPKLTINTDSQFLINSVTKWMPGWKRKGWRLASGDPVKNESDFKELDSVMNKINIKWNYVPAHRGLHGNEMADKLAKEGASRYGF